ncbi:methylated-DNA--[protein]-cysteine S-methyltransferase [Pseudoflavonifractor sp. AF19-9AC]|uniref:methylated-DNA--[protein]-cysteine S-methyltransferase n=1 Tax=Pseudoflavonifractor sp. AF19-9AC TaxID=2292244 RepID=UPI000E470BB5|nr:methylated-DNA--[protein]-cysteine S-methyltransferase [Pseudoflavonifractor sp. AF19-9AC]RHR06829.1 methylated-DNA--[protein]-cysteine S-methyltransferase [Pseudoflavonifractor sp. AF19-9AC]
MEFLLFDTSLGPIALGEEEGAITRLWLPGQPTPRLMSRETPLLKQGRQELLEYLAGERRDFDLPLHPRGTPFQRRVWQALEAIPYGQTRTYAQIAQAVDSPRGFRAVGMANHRNPIPIFIPCHRVVGSGGTLTGYAGGLELKKALLDLEGADLTEK